MVLISSPELVTREVTNLDTLGETVVAGTAELDSVQGLVAVENVVSVSVWETLGVVLGKVGLVSSGWVATETVVFGFPGETVIVGTAGLVSVPEWMIPEAVVSGLCVESVRVGIVVLASATELVISEVIISGTRSEIVIAGTAELPSAPGLVAIEGVVSNSLWETLGVVLGILRLVSSRWVTSETVVSGFPGRIVIVGIAELASFSVWVTPGAVVSDLYMESVTVGKVVLVCATELVTCEVTIPDTAGETVVAGTAELNSSPGLVATKNVVFDLLWETLEVFLGRVELVSSGWVTKETVVSDFSEKTVIVGTVELTFVSE